MAETEPKMAKQTANAPVARASWRPGARRPRRRAGGRGGPNPLHGLAHVRPLEVDQPAEQPQVHGQAPEARPGRRPGDRVVPAHDRVHGRGQEPELEDDQQGHHAEDADEDGVLLPAGQIGFMTAPRSTVRGSNPVAYTTPSATQVDQRQGPAGRAGDGAPALGLEVSVVTRAVQLPAVQVGRRAQARCEHFCP